VGSGDRKNLTPLKRPAAPKSRRRHLQLLSFGHDEVRVPIGRSPDIMMARKAAWQFAVRLGFSNAEATLIAAITSELARVIIHGGQPGQIVLNVLEDGAKRGLQVMARHRQDAAPEAATTSQRRQLAGVGKLVDEFTIVTEQGRGTTVTVKKWIG
jgi:serine/threonine-protein kinase RsbT